MTDQAFEPRNPDYAARIRDSFARQDFMTHLGAELGEIAPGSVDIVLPFRDQLRQQHGFFHAGTTAAIADSAAGYAAFSLFDAESSVLTVEFKLNLLAPGDGERLIARGRVIKPGSRLTICRADVAALRDSAEKPVATALVTLMRMVGMSDDRVRAAG